MGAVCGGLVGLRRRRWGGRQMESGSFGGLGPFNWFLGPSSLGKHCPHQEEESQCRDESHTCLHGPSGTGGREGERKEDNKWKVKREMN